MDMGMKIIYFLVSIIALLPALTLHEWAHGFAAYKLGDNTAKATGRLSLNPLDHLEPTGALMMLLVGFGWAKPVFINTRSLKNPKRDLAIISIAGPLMNIFVALISAFLYVLAYCICFTKGISGPTAEVVLLVFQYSALLNLGLGLFNLIPLPPLDGSNVLMCALPPRMAMQYSRLRYYTRYIILGIVLLSWMPYPLSLLSDIIFWPVSAGRNLLFNAFVRLAELIIAPLFGL